MSVPNDTRTDHPRARRRALDPVRRATMLLSVMGMLAACVGSSSSDSKAPGSKPLDEVAPWWADGAAIKVVEAGRTYVRLS